MKRALAALFLAVLGVHSAAAATVTFSGTLNASSAVFQRPEDNGVNPPVLLAAGDGSVVYYLPYTFTALTTGPHTFQMIAADFYDPTYTPGDPSYTDDGFFVLYVNTFNPAAPLSNAIRAFDDVVLGVQRMPNFAQNLVANQTYVLVTTTYGSNATGSFTSQISGPEDLADFAVPEPSSFLLLGAGLALLAPWRRFSRG